jgi:hypothetical protein
VVAVVVTLEAVVVEQVVLKFKKKMLMVIFLIQ